MAQLTEFLKKRKNEQSQKNIDVSKTKRQWLDALNSFFAMIKEWLNEPCAQGLIEMHDDKVFITEELFGKYAAPSLIIRTEWAIINIEPMARFVVGAQGRINMSSTNGISCILLYKTDSTFADNQWLYFDKSYSLKTIPLSAELFDNLVQSMLS